MKNLTKKLTYSIGILWVIFTLVFMASIANASKIDTLKSKISNQKIEISTIEEEIKKYQGEIDKTYDKTNTLKSQIRRLNANSSKLNSKIKLTKKKVATFSLNIERLAIQIKGSRDNIRDKKVVLSNIIKEIDESDKITLVEMVLSKDNLSDFFNDIDLLNNFKSGIVASLGEIKSLKINLERKKDEKLVDKKKSENLKSDLIDQKELVKINKNSKNKLLKETKSKESNYKKILAEKQILKEEFEKELWDFESKLRIEIDPSSIPQAGIGVLSWPLEKIYITQKFGKTVSSKRLYASGSHSGVDFRARTPKKVLAMGDGIVLDVGNTDNTCRGASFGKWILIDYENGLASAFGHLSLVKVKAGQKISRGQVVGYSGNTGHTTAPHLHVTVYAREGVAVRKMPSKSCSGKTYTLPLAPTKAYLNPLDYL